jgi:hypothetical protein
MSFFPGEKIKDKKRLIFVVFRNGFDQQITMQE